MNNQPLTEEELNAIYNWVDQIPLTRPKRNIARDFSDGVLLAEILYFFVPKFVDIHNYSGANSVKQKKYNWETMNTKVFKKMGFVLSRAQIDSVIQCQPEAIERVLGFVQAKLEAFLQNQPQQSYSPQRSTMQAGFQQNPTDKNQQQQSQFGDGWQKDQIIEELRETVEVLETKLNKMDELMKQKDQKIQRYQQILQQNGLL